MEHILINCTPREVRVAIVVDGVLQDLFIERDCARGLVGNVYLGKVVRVLPGMQSAFVDVGLERTAFLHVADIAEAHCEGEKPRPSRRSFTKASPSWCRSQRIPSAPRAPD